ncbi:hypothetical protein LINPERPRIM_LOCUS23084, partial [Linum perenne]
MCQQSKYKDLIKKKKLKQMRQLLEVETDIGKSILCGFAKW